MELSCLRLLLPVALSLSVITLPEGPNPDPGCESYRAWLGQGNPQTDTTGFGNNNFPEGSSTSYWSTALQGPPGTVVTVRGRYPRARFVSLQVYSFDELLDHLSDTEILPDAGQNNPFVSGSAQGTYTAYVVLGEKPVNPRSNTLYTGDVTDIRLIYRIYHATDPTSPGGETTNPELPDVWLGAEYLPSCPIRPVILPQDAIPWGRLDNGDWIGQPPSPEARIPASIPHAGSSSTRMPATSSRTGTTTTWRPS